MKHEVTILGRLGSFAAQFGRIIILLGKDTQKRPWLQRARLVLLYLKFTFKDLFFKRFLKKNPQREKFFGYEVFCGDYSSFRSLFIEIFVLGQYYFKVSRQDPYIIDCGANIGMSVIFFNFLYPNARILAFEPDEGSFALLEENVAHNNLGNVIVRNTALLDTKGDIAFYINKFNSSVNTAVGQIFTKEELVVTRVKSEILSEFINQKVDFLKVDVEGSEDLIMQELANKNALRFIKSMAVEYHPYLCKYIKNIGDFLDFLQSNRFSCASSKHQKNYLIYACNNQ